MYTVFLVTDREKHRRRLTRAVSAVAACEFLGDAYSVEEALEEVPRLNPGIVFVDLAVGGNRGISLIRELSTRTSSLIFVAFGASPGREADEARHALAAGATGFLRAADIDRELEQALRHASRGKIYLSEAVRREFESAA